MLNSNFCKFSKTKQIFVTYHVQTPCQIRRPPHPICTASRELHASSILSYSSMTDDVSADEVDNSGRGERLNSDIPVLQVSTSTSTPASNSSTITIPFASTPSSTTKMASTTTTATTNRTTTGSSIFKNALSSTAGAAVTATVVTPLDVVKVKLQAHVCPVGGHAVCEDPHHVSTSSEALKKIIRYDGFRGLWRGLNITLLLAIPTTGLYFTLYELFKQNYHSVCENNNQQQPTWIKNAACGASARVVAATLASPLEFARTNIQAGLGTDVWHVLKQVRTTHGIRGWWNGLGPTLIRDAPFSAIYWSSYEALKSPIYHRFASYFQQRYPNHNHAPSRSTQSIDMATYLTSGIAAGALAAVCTIPADVVKTRRQTASAYMNSTATHTSSVHVHNINSASSTSRSMKTTGSIGIVRDIIETEGIRGLFKGTGPRVAKVAPACAIMMGSFEMFKKFLGD